MNLNLVAVIGIVILLILMFNGMNIGWAMLLVGFFGYAYVVNFNAALGVLSTVPTTQAATYSLTVIPLFILMGNFAYASGISSGLYNACNKLLARLPGGLACATVGASACFGAICGSTQATAATIGVISIPEMRKYGYDDSLSCGSVSVGGTLGIMIPPSSPMIVYGLLAMVSIGKLFSAGVVPGILEAVLCMATIVVLAKVRPGLVPERTRYSAAAILHSLVGLIPMVILFGIVFVGMFSGWFTINESAAAGALVALLLMIILRKFTWKSFVSVMKETVKTTGMTYLILIGAVVFGNFLTITNMPSNLANLVAGLNVSRYVILAIIIAIYFLMGMLMDALPMMMLTVPIFLPIMTQLGFDELWFGIIIIVVMQLGLITPPVGSSCYVIAGIARDVPLIKIFKGSLPFCIPLLLTIILLTVFPQIALWLPNLA
ncbi:MAG: TRAP transporter large permease [Oscillospiraceae bacterium]|nr:TRAP transporter large permease [Oscillospiraceae bacterium]